MSLGSDQVLARKNDVVAKSCGLPNCLCALRCVPCAGASQASTSAPARQVPSKPPRAAPSRPSMAYVCETSAQHAHTEQQAVYALQHCCMGSICLFKTKRESRTRERWHAWVVLLCLITAAGTLHLGCSCPSPCSWRAPNTASARRRAGVRDRQGFHCRRSCPVQCHPPPFVHQQQ